MLKEFKQFINRGNIVDMAVGVIIGGAFTTLVKSFTVNLINPLLGLVTGSDHPLSDLKLQIGRRLVFTYGEFLNDVVSFLITAFIVFLVVKFVNKTIIKPKQQAAKQPSDELVTLREIKDLLAEQKK
ncbi:large-conductance mechanosensitive channel protein MscL [Fructobacillus sp. M1-13]|uniref:Large-conductance mechanosensitive channel n=1 Tax=Fructobacillus papyriferae TaxID=2713171 RepID=A0ABS5QNY0_9LACO|nr:large-conductance mechanosensitive channel protein MscL [Fructobacillus papyriferae]MCD2158848.1 large-conductance mechanosensitive channel protein MscL [Fructobacillus papyriferae]